MERRKCDKLGPRVNVYVGGEKMEGVKQVAREISGLVVKAFRWSRCERTNQEWLLAENLFRIFFMYIHAYIGRGKSKNGVEYIE